MRLLVTGGAGYIGSIVAQHLVARGDDVTVLDSLYKGHRGAVPDGADFVQVDLLYAEAVDEVVARGFDGVLHFAALSLVGESQEVPEKYWRGNVLGALNLLDAMRAADVKRIVFSSTAATYGEPESVPIREDAPTRPTNTYGASKLAVDHMLTSYATAHGFAAVSLRYFNVAGAAFGLGERHTTETHLIPLALQVAAGTRKSLTVYGDDYPTTDGTCVRDYIHVQDLSDAHLLALPAPVEGEHRIYNLGNGTGFTVQQVVDAVREVTGHPVPVEVGPRRAGDPAQLVASSDRIRADLGWTPEHQDLTGIVRDAWQVAQRR